MSTPISFAPMICIQSEDRFIFIQTIKLEPKTIDMFVCLSRNTDSNFPIVILIRWPTIFKREISRRKFIYSI